MSRIGVFGGSFDPVHLGHLSLASDALAQAGLDVVLFMPVSMQPFKLDANLSTDAHRLEMLRIATQHNPGFEVSELEIETGGISYTYLTLRRIRELLGPGEDLSFIAGTDSFLKIHTWKNADELLSENGILVGHRPGYKEDELEAQMHRVCSDYGTSVQVIDNKRLDISATDIRQRVATGLPIGHLVPPEVERYIAAHGLYRTIG